MSQTSASTPGSLIKCSSCSNENAPNVKFCAGCGHSLYEDCSSCNEPVLLDQKFCGGCGADLHSVLEAAREKHSQMLNRAIELGKSFEFAESLSLLKRIASQQDHRFADLISTAERAIEKVTVLRDRTTAGAEKAMARAKEAAAQEDKAEVVRLLKKVPENLLDEECQSLLAKSESHQEQTTGLVAALQASMRDLDYPLSSQLLDQLITLDPSEKKFRKLAKQVSEKLFKSAQRRFAKKDFAGALHKLSFVSESCRDENYDKTFQNIHNLSWMSTQIESEPYVTPSLARFALRFSKVMSTDAESKEMAQSIGAALKKAPADPRMIFPSHVASKQSWMGGPAAHFAFPTCVEFENKQPFRAGIARYNVAIGLAMQGLGLGRIQGQFVAKKGIFGGLGKRNSNVCWGLDLGTSGVRAVKLARTHSTKKGEASYTIIQTFSHEFESPLDHVSVADKIEEIVQDGLAKFKEESDSSELPIWVNLGGSELISRFMRLPPVKDKQAEQLLDTEITSRIPFPLEELEVVRWKSELGNADKHVHGRSAMIVTSRKQAVERRLKHFEQAEIKVTGIQADPVAVINLASVEFQSLWESVESSEESVGDSANQAVAIVDSGATSTSLILVSGEANWFWTLDAGGEDITTIIAKSTGKARREAEALKREPAKIVAPGDSFEPVEEKLAQLRSRLERLLGESEKQLGEFKIKQCWCMGGGTLVHGWLRHVMLTPSGE